MKVKGLWTQGNWYGGKDYITWKRSSWSQVGLSNLLLGLSSCKEYRLKPRPGGKSPALSGIFTVAVVVLVFFLNACCHVLLVLHERVVEGAEALIIPRVGDP